MLYLIISGAIVLGMAIMHDPDGTMKLVVVAMSVRGTTWITKKIIQQINLDASQIIDFTGWSIAGINIVGIIANAMGSADKVKDFFLWIFDKLAFWN